MSNTTTQEASQNGQQVKSQAEFVYRDQSVYTAEVTDQALSQSAAGHLQVVLQVRIHGMLIKPDNPNAGSIPIPPGVPDTKTIFLTWGDADYSREQFVLDLLTLGVKNTDPLMLDPAHPKYENLTGKHCLVKWTSRPEEPGKKSKNFWNIYRTNEGLKVESLTDQVKDTFKTHGHKTFRELFAAAKAKQAAQQGSTNPSDNTVGTKGF